MREDDDEVQDPDEDELDQDQDDRSVKIGPWRIGRDLLVLLGALTFLIIAIILTFLFPVGQDDGDEVATLLTETALGETSVAQTTVAQTGTVLGTTTVSPGVGSPSPEGTVRPGTPSPTGTRRPGGYPGPGEEAGTAYPDPGDAEPSPDGTAPAQGTAAAPTFDPLRTTSTARPTVTPASGAYPGPQPTSPQPTSPPQPTTPPQPTATAPPRPTATEEDLSEEPDATEPVATEAQQPDDTEGTPGTEPTGLPVDENGTPVSPGSPGVPAEPVSPVPTAVPVDVVSGEMRWSAAQSPIILSRDVQLAPGSMLIIEPGVEVRLGPGVAIFVDGAQLMSLGAPGNPVRFVSDTGARWEAIFGRPKSTMVFEYTEISGGGSGGTLLTSERDSELVIRNSRIHDNGGTLLITDTKLEVTGTEIMGNDLPYGAVIDAAYQEGNFVTLQGNRISGNRQSEGAPVVRLLNNSILDVLNLDIQTNLFRGNELGSNLLLSTNNAFYGTIACNTLVGGNLGLHIRSQTEQVPGLPRLSVNNNALDHHTPPIIPIYLDFGIGRGAASEVVLDMTNNWWGDASGPYHPQLNPLGRGDAVGENIVFEPWLTAPPACMPPE